MTLESGQTVSVDVLVVAKKPFGFSVILGMYGVNPAPPGAWAISVGTTTWGERGFGYDPPAISRTNSRIKPHEAVFESSPRDLSKAYLRF